VPFPLAPNEPRAQLRLRSLGWAFLAAVSAGALALLGSVTAAGMGMEQGLPAGLAAVVADAVARGLEPALRAGGCGFFYGLLAFHLQRVDPDDEHLQAGLVGAVCALRSLGAPFGPAEGRFPMMAVLLGWLPLWWPVIGSALVVQAARRWPHVLRP
jgi:hypothetical protein